MLSELFYFFVNISIIGSLMGLIILALGKVKWLPRFTAYLLWLVPLMRFWVPFGIANKYSLLTLLSKFTTKTVIVWEAAPEFTMTNSIMAANSYFPIKYKTNLLETVFTVASLVWIIVAVAAIIATFLLYSFTKSEMKSAKHIKGNVYKSDKITSPAVYGITHPKIIIPKALADKDIDYIILHEKVHIKRHDNLWRVIAIITACVHWFNPFVWVFLKHIFTDMELACDAKVIKNLDNDKKKEYAKAVLAAASGKAFFASAFGGAKTRVRIENIVYYKRLTFFSGICFGVLVITVAAILLTNAAI